MSIERAERLKQELTDKWVVVSDNAPELKRFANFTGKVRTVNMNCRALVEFDGGVDIGWYDIDPSFLKVVDGPKPKKAPAAHAEKPAAKAAPAAKPAAAPASGGSPLDKIRAAGGGAAPKAAPAGGSPLDKIRAAGGGGAKPAAPAAGGSPLDKIRAQGSGAKAAAESPAAETSAAASPAPAEEAAPAVAPKKPAAALPAGASPLDLIRAQGAKKKDG